MIDDVLSEKFPGAIQEDTYILHATSVLNDMGFSTENSLACIGVPREQISRALEYKLMQNWGNSYCMTSMGGVVMIGRTGFVALRRYVPKDFDRERYTFFQYTLTGIGPDGEVGDCQFPGQSGINKACYALYHYMNDLQDGNVDYQVYAGDLEYGLMKRRIRKLLPDSPAPDLMTVTQAAHDASLQDLEKLIAANLDPQQADWSIMTGIQICTGDTQYIWPGMSYAVVGGEKQVLALS